ncbi:MAG: PAS domain-containing protein, partial [Candidatus Omnitrophica bacterium]|nr:PAS domain-containing protein [Candidatus Omnitrophota bacterium]
AVVANGCREDHYSIEYRIRHKDGSYRWVEDNNRMALDATRQKIAPLTSRRKNPYGENIT